MVEKTHMALAIRLEPNSAGGSFDKSPFQIVVDVAAGTSVPDPSATGDHAGHEAGITGEVFDSRKTFDFAYLQPDERRENLADTGKSSQ
jgi:hypothetical protein